MKIILSKVGRGGRRTTRHFYNSFNPVQIGLLITGTTVVAVLLYSGQTWNCNHDVKAFEKKIFISCKNGSTTSTWTKTLSVSVTKESGFLFLQKPQCLCPATLEIFTWQLHSLFQTRLIPSSLCYCENFSAFQNSWSAYTFRFSVKKRADFIFIQQNQN